MEWLDALILGIVQGLSEYLPISSSGHLEIFREILGINLPNEDILEFDVMLHAATVLSTLVVLWNEFFPLCRSFFTIKRDDNFYYVCKILISCIPVAVVGLFFKDTVESFFGGNLTTVGICLCITAALLAFAYFFRTKPEETNKLTGRVYRPRDITWLDAFVIGIAQSIAVLPGLSRSGTTIATGILLGDKREKVASFSFLMVIIPILGETLLNIKDMISEPAASSNVGMLPLTIGFIASFVVGCLACKWMLNIVKKGKLVWFAVYCVIMGIICICW
ncbi:MULTISPECIES: undecaprenyl-diphosphate phosphatase [Muribaculum]|jgi:undecaprenyl-diphosphatase|uniref:undecaprenyl-diphosphate phosphatase n=6 Tax=Muribaculaceae TaxID=2005473 RepID=UPI000F462C7B|nr:MULTISPECIES: undecaprenyl-diphosphate phosphatase [Muribaculum]MCX4276558.1 undecaprenyl-diphosphate phosphatase [Muribaculum sp.]ROT16039.1 undecaprenyl-diphosphate phosphatase [Muribaculaceae bacterium Isolate-102 (HZI)]